MVLYPSGLRERSAKPSFIGSNPIGTFNLTFTLIQFWRKKLHLRVSDAVFSFKVRFIFLAIFPLSQIQEVLALESRNTEL